MGHGRNGNRSTVLFRNGLWKFIKNLHRQESNPDWTLQKMFTNHNHKNHNMSLTYRIIAPLIVPKLKRGCESPNMESFMFSWNKNTGEQTIEISDERGSRFSNGQVSIAEIMQEGTGRRLIDLLNGLYKDWETLYGIIDINNKKITLIFKDHVHNTIGIRTY